MCEDVVSNVSGLKKLVQVNPNCEVTLVEKKRTSWSISPILTMILPKQVGDPKYLEPNLTAGQVFVQFDCWPSVLGANKDGKNGVSHMAMGQNLGPRVVR